MISPNVRFVDVNPWHWRRLYDAVFVKNRGRGLTILVQGGRVVKAYDSFSGLRPEWKTMDAGEPEALARVLYQMERPDWVQVLDVTAVREYGVAVQTMHDWREDSDAYLARCFQMLHHYPGGLVRYPHWPRELHVAGIPYSTWARLVAGVPDGQTIVLGVFEEGYIWICVICRVVGGRIVLITGSDAFIWEGTCWPHESDGCQRFLAAVEVSVGPPYIALLCTRDIFDRLVTAERKWDLLLESIRRGQAKVYPDLERITFGRE